MSHRCEFTVGIVGTGRVGMTAAYSLITNGIPTELVLVGRDRQKVEGEKLDLEHALPFLPSVDIIATDDYADLQGADVILYTAGAAQEDGETRLDLAQKNTKILEEILPKILEHAPHAVIIMVTNPVDVLTAYAYKIAPDLRYGQVFGSGTLLDTARFRYHLSEFLDVNPRSVHTYILGEHGDSSFPVLSSASLGGAYLLSLKGVTEEKIQQAYQAARQAAYRVIEGKGATYYAIGTVLSHIVEAVNRDSRTVMPVSVPLRDYFGENDVALSVPCIVGRRGVAQVMPIALDEREEKALHHSADVMRQSLAHLAVKK